MSTADTIVDLIDEHGPMTIIQLHALMPELTRAQVKGAVDRSTGRGHIHGPGSRAKLPGVYKSGPAPGWMPHPMPVNSVWQYAVATK